MPKAFREGGAGPSRCHHSSSFRRKPESRFIRDVSHVPLIPAKAGIQPTSPLHEDKNGVPVAGFAAAGNERNKAQVS